MFTGIFKSFIKPQILLLFHKIDRYETLIFLFLMFRVYSLRKHHMSPSRIFQLKKNIVIPGRVN